MKKRITFLALFVCIMINHCVQAQTPKIDSLRNTLESDTANFEVLQQLALELSDIYHPESIKYQRMAKSVAIVQGDTPRIVASSRILGQFYNREGDVDMAIKELAPLIAIAKRHDLKEDIKKLLNSLAAAYSRKGEYDKSLDYHLRSLALKEKDHDQKGVSVSLNNIGVIYFDMENFDRALHYFNACLELKLAINDKFDLDLLYYNLGQCYERLGIFDKSQNCMEKILSTCAPNCTSHIMMRAETAMGEIRLREGRFDEAKTHFNKSLILSKQANDLECTMDDLLALVKVGFGERNLVAARNYLNEISSLDRKDQAVKQLQLFYKLSVRYYTEKRNVQMIKEFEGKYSRLTQKIDNSEMHRRIMEIQINFIENENNEKLENQKKLVEAQAKIIDDRNIISLLLFGISTLAIVLLVVFFKLNEKKAAINKRLDELVRERTFELDNSRNELVHSYGEQKIVLERIGRELIAALATIQGLSNVATAEKFANVDAYLKGAETTIFKSIQIVRNNVSSEFVEP